ncbi:MAG TPA: class I SAM-dependent methyltransferase [Rectinemataceae bacterium]
MILRSEKDERQAEYFSNRLAKNEKTLRRWARSEGIQALRLYDADIPEVPLYLDRYGAPENACAVLGLYERPYEKPEEEETAWLVLMVEAASASLSIPPERIFLKRRRRMRGAEQYMKADAKGRSQTMYVEECGLRFHVNLSDYLDTGLFLDHRPARLALRRSSRGKRVLNLFAYTGSFSINAAAGGAAQVTSVDLSNTYLEWTRKNFALNGLETSAHAEIRSDCMEYLSKARARRERFDLIVADPPTYSNSSMTARDFDIARDWPSLLEACSSLLESGGSILFSTNSRRLRWEPKLVALPWEDRSEASIPRDFRDRRIHRCWVLGEASGFPFE